LVSSIGAWIGDVAIGYGVFAKQRGGDFQADCYDPSRAGQLIPYNITLNKLDGMIRFLPVAADITDGINIFSERWGHSDSSRLAFIDVDSQILTTSHVVETRTLAQMLPASLTGRHVIVKIDIEGLDAAIVMQTLDKLYDVSLIIEFTPRQPQYDDIGGAEYFIETLQRTHVLFDVYPVTQPSWIKKLQDPFEFTLNVRNRDYGYADIRRVALAIAEHTGL
jgi:FkbM family methyltransferase